MDWAFVLSGDELECLLFSLICIYASIPTANQLWDGNRKTHTESVHKSCSLGNRGVREQHTRKDSCCKAARVCVCAFGARRSGWCHSSERLQSRARAHTLILALLCRCWWDCFCISGGGGQPIARGSSHESGIHAAVCLWLRGGSGGHQLCRAGLSLRSAAGALFCL